MAQTVAVVRNTLTATGAGTTDFTKTGFGTPTAAIIIACNANTGSNPQVNAAMSIGFWDGTLQRAAAGQATDNVATTSCLFSSDDSYGVICAPGATAGAANSYTVSAVTDGIRLTLSVDNTAAERYCTVIMFAGVSSAVATFTPNATQNGTQASSTLSFTPELVFFLAIGRTAADSYGAGSFLFSFGFADNTGLHRMLAFISTNGAADEDANLQYSETRCVGQVSAGALNWSGEITTWGADSFTMTTREGASGSDVCFYLALGGADLSFDAGTLTTTTDAANDIVVATDVAPDAVLVGLSTATSTTIETGSGANGLMFGMADANGQFCHNISVEDGAATTNANSAAQAAALIDLDTSSAGTRTDMIDGVVTLNSANFTINPSLTDGTARKGWWVAFGAAAAGGTTYPQLERGIRGMNRGMNMGMAA